MDSPIVFKIENKKYFKVIVGYGQYYCPDAKNFTQNKYAMPANDQFNFDLFFFNNPNKKGLSIECLTSIKRAIDDTYDNPNFIINKVNMVNYNLILTYKF